MANYAHAVTLTDDEIAGLLAEPKPTVDGQQALTALAQATPANSHRRHRVPIATSGPHAFVLHLRQSSLDPYDFSVILTYVAPDGTTMNLRRHNGPSHQHRNAMEGDIFRGRPHVHMATERYHAAGHDPEGYAEPTEAFHDLATALQAMLADTGFAPPPQLSFSTP